MFLQIPEKIAIMKAKKVGGKLMKKYLAMLLTVAVLLSLITACGEKEKETEELEESEKSEKTEETTAPEPEMEKEVSAIELQYYYVDGINSFYNQFADSYGDNADVYLKVIYGLDSSLPLNQQYTDETKTETWADYFVRGAIAQAENDYAMSNLAKSEKFELSESSKSTIDSSVSMLETYAAIYGYENASQYLSAIYGNGATLRSYKEYYERSLLASEYYTAHADTFVYTDEQRDAYQADKMATFNSYSYTSCYLTYTDFRVGTTTDGRTTYSDAQNEEGRRKMAEYAEKLKLEITNKADLEEAIKTAPVASGKSLSVTEETNVLYSDVRNAGLRSWLADATRRSGDFAVIPDESIATNADGVETTVVDGYYVVIFDGVSDNEVAMADIGYIFVPYKGGVEDEETGEIIYGTDDVNEARVTAENCWQQWLGGERTAASFETLKDDLLNKNTVSAGDMVENLNPNSPFSSQIIDWALDSRRTSCESTIIQTDEGFYILLYVGKSALTYRQYLIDQEMRAQDYQKWYEDALATVDFSNVDTSNLDKAVIIKPGLN